MIKIRELSSKHQKTLADVLTIPPRAGIKWNDVVSLIHTLDPGNEMDKGAVNGLREWFENVIGVKND